MPAKILVTEKIADEGISALESKGYVVDEKLGLTPEQLRAIVGDYEALIVRSQTQVDEKLLRAGKNLKVIGRAGVTVDNIDIEAANELDIIVCNAPTSNIVSAAEHTFALMLSCARKVPQANQTMHAHKWNRSNFTGVELYAKTLALFGLGRVGSMVAERAAAFGMRVLAYDPYCNPERATQLSVTLVDDKKEILGQADFVSIHLPVTSTTKGMFGPEDFANFKTGAILINTSRPAILDMNSLADFVAARKIASCGVDVFDDEPCENSPLHELENAIITPHISALTKEAQVRSGMQIADYVWAGLEGSLVPTALSANTTQTEMSRRIAPFLPAANMMGRVVRQIKGRVPRKVKVQMMGNLAELNPTSLVASVLEGMLESKHAQVQTMLEAKSLAERHGVEISVTNTEVAGEYAAGIRLDADGLEIAATVFGEDKLPRIISIMGYKIDVALTKHALIFEYDDQPGVCGKIGTVLGDNNINISTMQIATSADDKTALVFVNVGEEISDEVIDKFKELIDLKNLFKISL